MFLFLIVFNSLNIPLQDQHKTLFWGIMGAVVFRGILIFLGATALERWEWITYVFGVIILYAAYRAFRKDPGKRVKRKERARREVDRTPADHREDPRGQILCP